MSDEWSVDQPESWTVGDSNAGHVTIDPTGLHAYATDGVTKVLDVDLATGAVTITAASGSSIPGSGVGDAVGGDNLIRNGSMADTRVDPLTGLTAPTLWGYNSTATRLSASSAYPGYANANVASTAELDDIFNLSRVTVQPGDTLYSECYLFASTAGWMTAGLAWLWYDANDVQTGETDTALTTVAASSVATAEKRTALITVPAGAHYARLMLRYSSPGGITDLFAGLFYAYRVRPVDAISSGQIHGKFVVGSEAGAHAVLGADSNGADGLRLYAADGVTPLIDLNITGGAPVVSIQTAPGGNRVQLDTAAHNDRVKFFTGDAAETAYGWVGAPSPGAAPGRNAESNLTSPNLGHGLTELSVISAQADNGKQPFWTVNAPFAATPAAWTPLTLANGWTNYGSDGGGLYAVAAWRILPDGSILLKGLIKGGTLTDGTIVGSGVVHSGNYLFPTTENHVLATTCLPAAGGNPIICRVTYLGTGNVNQGSLNVLGVSGAGAGCLVSLSGLVIPTAPLGV